MLEYDELNNILSKKKLQLEDLLLLESHLLYITNLFNEYDSLPEDVYLSLSRDVDLIIEKLKNNMNMEPVLN